MTRRTILRSGGNNIRALALVATLCGSVGLALGQSPPATLKVTGIRKMTEAEYTKRISEQIGTKYIVGFRLEVSGQQGIYVLSAGPIGAPPLGYAFTRIAGNIIWQEGDKGRGHSTSLGVDKLTKTLGARWTWLPASSAYEWEVEAESSTAGVDESRSVFVRTGMKNSPTELFSTWYIVDDNACSENSGERSKETSETR